MLGSICSLELFLLLLGSTCGGFSLFLLALFFGFENSNLLLDLSILGLFGFCFGISLSFGFECKLFFPLGFRLYFCFGFSFSFGTFLFCFLGFLFFFLLDFFLMLHLILIFDSGVSFGLDPNFL